MTTTTKRPTVRRATAQEVAAYAASMPRPLYPLSHWVTMGGIVCAVERLASYHPDDPRYEVIAPRGHHFTEDSLHTLLCYDLADLRDRTWGMGVVPCGASCRTSE